MALKTNSIAENKLSLPVKLRISGNRFLASKASYFSEAL